MAGRCLVTSLRDLVAEYLALRRALGDTLHCEAGRCYVPPPSSSRAVRRGLPRRWPWRGREPVGATPSMTAHWSTIIRSFAEYVRLQDPRTEVPSAT